MSKARSWLTLIFIDRDIFLRISRGGLLHSGAAFKISEEDYKVIEEEVKNI